LFTLLNPLFLVGALAAGIPIAIHLLAHKRSKPVEWPSLKFLASSQKRTARRKRLQDLLLLLLRVSLLVLLSVALAKPFMKGAGMLAADAPTSAVIVLDNSYSMSCEHNGVPRFAAAKEAALEVIGGLKASHFVAVIFSDGDTPERLRKLSLDQQGAADAVRSAVPGHSGGALGGRVVEAMGVVGTQKTPNREVYIITDAQRRGWNVDAAKLRRAVTGGREPVVSVIDCSQPEFTNSAVEHLSLRATSPLVGEPVTIEAKIRNYSARPVRKRVTFHAGAEAKAERSVSIAPEAMASVSFLHSFDSPGVHSGYVEIGEDSIAADNRRHFAMRVEATLRVLLVEGRSSAIAEGRPAYYLVPAFLAARTGRLERTSSLRPVTIPAAKLPEATLSEYDAVFLLGLQQMDGLTARRLREYVWGGGGLIIAPGEGFDAQGFRRHLGKGEEAILPAVIGGLDGASAGPVICRLSEIDPVHRVTRILKSLDRSALGSVMLRKRLRLDVEYGSSGIWLMRADDGSAIMAAGDSGRGKVLLMAMPPDASWSNLAKRGNVFVPLVRSMVYYAAHREASSTATTTGSPLPFDFPKREGAVSLAVTDPAGRTTETTHPAPEGEKGYPPAELPGIYEVHVKTAPTEELAYAVNVDAAESDLTPMRVDEVEKLFNGCSSEFFVASVGGDAGSGRAGLGQVSDLVSRIREGVKLWDAFLAAVLAMAVFECFFSNRALPKAGRDMAAAEVASEDGGDEA